MISRIITLKFLDGSTVTKTVFGPNELILSRNINKLAQDHKACGWSTQATQYYQGR